MVERAQHSGGARLSEPRRPPHDIYTVANIITVLRLILVPFFFSVLLNGTNDTLAFVLFALAASTDWLDGQIARRTGTVTDDRQGDRPAGRPAAHRLGVIGLYIEDRLPLWIVLVLVARDVYLLYGAWRLASARPPADPGDLHRQD